MDEGTCKYGLVDRGITLRVLVDSYSQVIDLDAVSSSFHIKLTFVSNPG